MHDVLDAQFMYERDQNEEYLRRVIMPLENLLINHKKVFIKDSAVSIIDFEIYGLFLESYRDPPP